MLFWGFKKKIKNKRFLFACLSVREKLTSWRFTKKNQIKSDCYCAFKSIFTWVASAVPPEECAASLAGFKLLGLEAHFWYFDKDQIFFSFTPDCLHTHKTWPVSDSRVYIVSTAKMPSGENNSFFFPPLHHCGCRKNEQVWCFHWDYCGLYLLCILP